MRACRSDCHYSGLLVTQQLDATYPHTPGAPSTCAYLVLLRVEIARFTRTESARLCCSNPHLIPTTCAAGFQWTAVSCYAALCSPDVPPVRCFHPTLARRPCGLHQRQSGGLHTPIIAAIHNHISKQVDEVVENGGLPTVSPTHNLQPRQEPLMKAEITL